MATMDTEPQTTIIRRPSVYLVGRQQIDDGELARFLTDEGVDRWTTDTDVAGQKLVEVAGRLCYTSYARPRPGGNATYIGHILEVGHGSVLEHAVFNFIITGVSRSLTHELVRHRAGWSFSQLSQRFVDESACAFVEPDAIAEDPELHRIWHEAIASCQRAYRELADGLAAKFTDLDDKTLRRKRAREAARSVLPNATETKIFVTANARALRTFLELRGSRHADAEIRKVALEVLRVVRAEAPHIFPDFEVVAADGQDAEIINRFKKV
jgi:thymidylate synthase (FAD)